jgi:hypothetical protein
LADGLAVETQNVGAWVSDEEPAQAGAGSACVARGRERAHLTSRGRHPLSAGPVS